MKVVGGVCTAAADLEQAIEIGACGDGSWSGAEAAIGSAMNRVTRLCRILLVLGVALAVVLALLPKPPHLPIDSLGDKFEHSLAFVVLSLLAAGGFPEARLARIGERLSFLGAMIEVAQSVPALHRDCDILDWATDTIAIVVTLLIVAIVRAQRRERGSQGAGDRLTTADG